MRQLIIRSLDKIKKFFTSQQAANDNRTPGTENLFIGVDTARPNGDVTILGLETRLDGGRTFFRIPNLKFETFAEAKQGFGDFFCLKECNPLSCSQACFHVFEFPCPACRETLRFNVEEMELLAELATEQTVCPKCWEKSGAFEKLAA